ncbi:MAG: lipocalin-like domain-containing protein [Thiogranum sp.]|nr:lipocalin-like domain-containing protein [Thiogranum sp.]
MRLLLVVMLLLVSACERQQPDNGPVVSVDQVMGGQPDPGFARAMRPREFKFPEDHAAHPDYATEWWYLTGNLNSDSGRRFGYQLTLFRVGLRPGEAAQDSAWRTNQVYMGHLAISDIDGNEHHSAERFARAAAGLAGSRLAPFEVWLGPWSMRGGADLFPLTVTAQDQGIGLALTLSRGEKPLVLQGERGLSRKSARPGNASYYYSYTRLPTAGELRLGDSAYPVQGDSWMDREWSSSALDQDQTGWDWFALQLEDGRDLMYYQLRNRQGGAHPFSRGTLVEKDGSVHPLRADQVTLVPQRDWSAEDGAHYPVGWRLQVPDYQLDLEVNALIDDQLMDHSVRYWEGAVGVSGSHRGRGYLELSGYTSYQEP